MSAYKRDDKQFKAKLVQLADKKSLKAAQLVTKTVRLPETCPQGAFCAAGYGGGCASEECPKDYRGPKETKEAPNYEFRPAQLRCIARGFHFHDATFKDDDCIDCGLPPYPSILTIISNFFRRIFNV